MYVVELVSSKRIDRVSTTPGALHAFHQGVFAGRVTADDSLKGLVTLDVV